MNPDEPQADRVLHISGYDVYLHANTYFHVEGNHNAAATVIAENLAAAGADLGDDGEDDVLGRRALGREPLTVIAMA